MTAQGLSEDAEASRGTFINLTVERISNITYDHKFL